LLEQIMAEEAERMPLAAQQVAAPAPAAMLLDIKGIGRVRRHPLVGRASSDTSSTIDERIP
jgi:hypothetical protein